MRIVNLTQHVATKEQIADGVFEPVAKEQVKDLLTFAHIPTPEELADRAELLAAVAWENGAEAAMIGGAPYLMAPLERALVEHGIDPCYAFTERRSTEVMDPDTGEVRKTQILVHTGFVWAISPQREMEIEINGEGPAR